MSQWVRFTFPDGQSIVVEQDEPQESGPAGISRKIKDASHNILEDLLDMQQVLVRSIQAMEDHARPHEVKLCLGVKFTAEAGAILARTSGEGNVQVELTWKEGGSAQAQL